MWIGRDCKGITFHKIHLSCLNGPDRVLKKRADSLPITLIGQMTNDTAVEQKVQAKVVVGHVLKPFECLRLSSADCITRLLKIPGAFSSRWRGFILEVVSEVTDMSQIHVVQHHNQYPSWISTRTHHPCSQVEDASSRGLWATTLWALEMYNDILHIHGPFPRPPPGGQIHNEARLKHATQEAVDVLRELTAFKGIQTTARGEVPPVDADEDEVGTA